MCNISKPRRKTQGQINTMPRIFQEVKCPFKVRKKLNKQGTEQYFLNIINTIYCKSMATSSVKRKHYICISQNVFSRTQAHDLALISLPYRDKETHQHNNSFEKSSRQEFYLTQQFANSLNHETLLSRCMDEYSKELAFPGAHL